MTDKQNITSSDMDSSEIDVSKSQRKRDAHAIRDLGAELASLSSSDLADIPLPDDVRVAVSELKTLTARGARKRQLGYLAKRLRNADLEPIYSSINDIRLRARAMTMSHHKVEHWRDQLLGEGCEMSAEQALTRFIEEFDVADRQALRQLQRKALKEKAAGKPPASARELFRFIRDIVGAGT